MIEFEEQLHFEYNLGFLKISDHRVVVEKVLDLKASKTSDVTPPLRVEQGTHFGTLCSIGRRSFVRS